MQRTAPLNPGPPAASLPRDESWREREFYAELVPYVHRIVRRALGSDWREHDLVQEVLCRVLHYQHQLRDDRQFRSWVRAITFNVICSELRERRMHRAATQDVDLDVAANLEHTVVARDLLARLHSKIDRLPRSERAAFVLFFVEQRTVTEIAELEGYSLATAQRRLRRPRRILRTFLEQHPAIVAGGPQRPTSVVAAPGID